MYIIDERCLTNQFESEIGKKLVEARNTIKTADEFIEYRKQQLNLLDNEYKNLEESKKLEKINNYSKSSLSDLWGYDGNRDLSKGLATIYFHKIYSQKFLDNEHRFKTTRHGYKDINEVKLLNAIKTRYGEIDDKKLENNEEGD
jgi:hypothetical protein